VQFGDKKWCKFKNPTTIPVQRGGSLLGQFSHEVSRGTLILIHLSWVGPTTGLTCQVGPTSMPRGRLLLGHVTPPDRVVCFHWSISTASVRDTDTWQHGMKPPHQGLYTCQTPIGPPHYMWASHNTENN
jgi:hypothetical protein